MLQSPGADSRRLLLEERKRRRRKSRVPVPKPITLHRGINNLRVNFWFFSLSRERGSPAQVQVDCLLG
jgi:hypothetical protein